MFIVKILVCVKGVGEMLIAKRNVLTRRKSMSDSDGVLNLYPGALERSFVHQAKQHTCRPFEGL